jgi:hypothetical protein
MLLFFEENSSVCIWRSAGVGVASGSIIVSGHDGVSSLDDWLLSRSSKHGWEWILYDMSEGSDVLLDGAYDI